MVGDNSAAQRVLGIVRMKGPVIPTQVSIEIGTSSLIASAILAEFVSNNQLKLSSVKIGSSPLYYAPGQEEKLQEYVKYLHEKERKAYDVLKSAQVLRDKVLEPVMRFALRQIKDFAVPLQVKAGEGVELFWKWYMLPNEGAEPIVKKLLGAEMAGPRHVQEAQKTIEVPKMQKKLTKKEPAEFIKSVMEYFSKNSIEIIERIENKKKAETEFLINVPSPVGNIKYYCKAKDKKICNDGDLSTALVQGQSRKLPALFLTTGKLTKKASQMLEREFSMLNVKKI